MSTLPQALIAVKALRLGVITYLCGHRVMDHKDIITVLANKQDWKVS